jgi:hypothetical protein
MTKYGAKPEETSKTASGAPGVKKPEQEPTAPRKEKKA